MIPLVNNVFAHKKLTGMGEDVFQQIVLAIRCGMGSNVSVGQDLISMEKLALNVSMGKYGMQPEDPVNVRMDLSGLATTASNRKHVQEEGYGTAHLKSVFALSSIIGLEISVKYNLNAAADKDIINYQISVNV